MKKQIITMGIMLSIIAISVPVFADTQDNTVTATNTVQQQIPQNWNGEKMQPPFDFKNGKKPPKPPVDENGNPLPPPNFTNSDGNRPEPPDFKNGKKPPEPPKDENGNPVKPPEFSKKSATST